MSETINTTPPTRIRTDTYDRILNYVFIAYAFVIPLSRAGIVLFSAMIILLFIFKKDSFAQVSSLKNNKVFSSFVLFIGFYLLSLLWTNPDNLQQSLKEIAKYWYLLPAFVLALALKKDQIVPLLTAFSFGMLASELISYGIFFELFTYKNVPASNPSPFMKHLEYSIFLAFAALVTLSRLIFEKSNKYKLLYALFFTSLTINLFITGGRSGQLAFVVSIVVLFLYNYENKIKAVLVSTLLGAIILTAAYNTSDLFHFRVNKAMTDVSSVLDGSSYCTSWGTRAGALIIAKDIFLEHPLIGVGAGDNIDLLREAIDNKYEHLSCMRWYMHFHNQYAEILTEIGLIGLALFLWMFYRIFSIPLQGKQFISIKIMLLSVFLVGFIAEPYLVKQFTLALFSLILGIIMAQSRVDNDDVSVLSVEPVDPSLDIEPTSAVLAGDLQ